MLRRIVSTCGRTVAAAVILLCVPVVALAQTETTEYYGLDAIGSVRIVFDPSGTVLARLDYAPFGRELTPSPNAPDGKFAGLFRDGEAGLDYAQARSYQVRTGRFSAPDPVYAGMFDPQKWNRYAYAGSNPVKNVDPTGKDWITVAALAGYNAYNSIPRFATDVTVSASMPGFTFGEGAQYMLGCWVSVTGLEHAYSIC